MTSTATLPPPLSQSLTSPAALDVVDLMRACRFCLRHPSTGEYPTMVMRELPADQLEHTDIPHLFEAVTAVKLDLAAGYSELLCNECEQRMRSAAQTRVDLLRVVQDWQTLLYNVLDVRKQQEPDQQQPQRLRPQQLNHHQVLKTELNAGALMAVEPASTGDCAASFGTRFDGSDLDNVKLETPNYDDDVHNDSGDERDADNAADAFNNDDLTMDMLNAAATVVAEAAVIADANDERDDGNSSESGDVGNGSEQNDDDDDDDDDEPLAQKYRPKEQSNRRWQSENLPASSSRRSTRKPPVPPRRGRKPAFGKPPDGEPLTCDICNAQLSSRNILITHMRKKHEPKPIATHPNEPAAGSTCHICGKTGLKSMVHHMRDHRRADQYKCAHCPKTFCRADMRLQHERTHTGERPFICEMCGFSFTAPTGLRRHMQLRHSGPNGKLATLVQRPQKQQIVRARVLPPMPESAEDAATVLRKLPPVSHAGRLQCPLCLNTYANRPSMHTHMKIQHGAEGVAEWKLFLATVCAVCGVRCADAEALNAHRVVHQPYQCEICRRRFESRITWELHVQKHAKKERRYKCEVCEALFPCSFTLRMHHRRAHTDYRPFPCPQCGLAFAENAEMMAHMRKRHTISGTHRSHACELCPAGTPAFKTTEALRSHMENHTGLYRYQCKVCLRRQSSAVVLLDHMRGYHPRELKAMDEDNARQAEEMAQEMAAATAEAVAVEALTVVANAVEETEALETATFVSL